MVITNNAKRSFCLRSSTKRTGLSALLHQQNLSMMPRTAKRIQRLFSKKNRSYPAIKKKEKCGYCGKWGHHESECNDNPANRKQYDPNPYNSNNRQHLGSTTGSTEGHKKRLNVSKTSMLMTPTVSNKKAWACIMKNEQQRNGGSEPQLLT